VSFRCLCASVGIAMVICLLLQTFQATPVKLLWTVPCISAVVQGEVSAHLTWSDHTFQVSVRCPLPHDGLRRLPGMAVMNSTVARDQVMFDTPLRPQAALDNGSANCVVHDPVVLKKPPGPPLFPLDNRSANSVVHDPGVIFRAQLSPLLLSIDDGSASSVEHSRLSYRIPLGHQLLSLHDGLEKSNYSVRGNSSKTWDELIRLHDKDYTPCAASLHEITGNYSSASANKLEILHVIRRKSEASNYTILVPAASFTETGVSVPKPSTCVVRDPVVFKKPPGPPVLSLDNRSANSVVHDPGVIFRAQPSPLLLSLDDGSASSVEHSRLSYRIPLGHQLLSMHDRLEKSNYSDRGNSSKTLDELMRLHDKDYTPCAASLHEVTGSYSSASAKKLEIFPVIHRKREASNYTLLVPAASFTETGVSVPKPSLSLSPAQHAATDADSSGHMQNLSNFKVGVADSQLVPQQFHAILIAMSLLCWIILFMSHASTSSKRDAMVLSSILTLPSLIGGIIAGEIGSLVGLVLIQLSYGSCMFDDLSKEKAAEQLIAFFASSTLISAPVASAWMADQWALYLNF